MPEEIYEFHIDQIQHLDDEPLIELHKSYTALVQTFQNNQFEVPSDIAEIHETLEARLHSVGITLPNYEREDFPQS